MRDAAKVTLAFTAIGVLASCTSGQEDDRPTPALRPTASSTTEPTVIGPVDTAAVEESLPRNQLITLTNAE